MFKIIAEAIGLAAHATLPRSLPSHREAPPPVQARAVQARAVVWLRQG
jgi:hypothetical protein